MPDPRDTFFRPLVRLPARVASGLVRAYQLTVSPALAVINPSCGCRFTPTCSHYAIGALQEHGLFAGTVLTFRRLSKCAPWHPGGLDPVPTPRPVCKKAFPPSSAPLVTRHSPLS